MATRKVNLPIELTPTSEKVSSIENNYANKLFWLIIHIVIAFVLGLGVAFILQNIIAKEHIIFSTLDIINMFLSFILSGGSIVLAITAIVLSKNSERVITDRSDASIKMQHEIYTQTIQALKRIESSTGVTEKRIEDLMNKQATNIVRNVFPDEKSLSGLNREQMIKELERNISKDSSTISLEEEFPEVKSTKRLKYEAYQDSVLEGIAHTKGMEVIKKGNGYLGTKGEDLVDGVFKLEEIKFSVSTFFGSDTYNFNAYIFDIARELHNGTFDQSFFVFDQLSAKQEEFEKIIKESSELISATIPRKIHILSGNADNVVTEINERLSRKD